MDQKLIKILAINSSPKSDGHTARFLEHFEKAAKQLNAEVTHMDLYHEKIQFCCWVNESNNNIFMKIKN